MRAAWSCQTTPAKDNKARRVPGESGFPIGSGTDTSNKHGRAKTDATKIHKNPKKGNGKAPSNDNPKGESKQVRVSTEVWKCLSETDKDQLKLGNKTAMVEALEKFEKVKAGTDGNLGDWSFCFDFYQNHLWFIVISAETIKWKDGGCHFVSMIETTNVELVLHDSDKL